jgi:hypothetical protein
MTAVNADCLSTRISVAGRHVDRGEWASGHAIASRLLRCSQASDCSLRGDCACAAELLLCDIRRMLDGQAA